MTIVDQALDDALADPKTYTDEPAYHALLTRLRHEDPVHWTAPQGYRPFWTVTRYADVAAIEKQSDLFVSGPRSVLRSLEQEESIREMTGTAQPIRSLIQMDQPDHRMFRKLTQAWFMPKHLKEVEAEISALSDHFIEKLEKFGGECDFTGDVAMWFPLRVVMHILGVPAEDAPLMLRLTQQHFAASDPEVVAEGGEIKAGSPVRQVFDYFDKLVDERRKNPKNDAISLLANAEIDGKPIAPFELNSYLFLFAVAGHDSTSSSISGMVHAMIDHPAEFDRLRGDLELLPRAIDESIRWTSPVRHFFRTASADYELRGRTIREGDSIMLSYPSANRDKEVYDAPFEFKVDRPSNPHLSFGYGPHLCLGQNLAKLEMRTFFGKLLPRLEAIDLAGDPRWIETSFVGGLKSLPIRYRLN
jgi:cytochrome P450